jgi:hypothetical protein
MPRIQGVRGAEFLERRPMPFQARERRPQKEPGLKMTRIQGRRGAERVLRLAEPVAGIRIEPAPIKLPGVGREPQEREERGQNSAFNAICICRGAFA